LNEAACNDGKSIAESIGIDYCNTFSKSTANAIANTFSRKYWDWQYF